MAWRTSEEANFDLERIGETGALAFGTQHARDYVLRILDMFDTLAIHPTLAPERQAMFGMVRLMPIGAHNILYVVEAEDVIILRVLHGLQNWFEQL